MGLLGCTLGRQSPLALQQRWVGHVPRQPCKGQQLRPAAAPEHLRPLRPRAANTAVAAGSPDSGSPEQVGSSGSGSGGEAADVVTVLPALLTDQADPNLKFGVLGVYCLWILHIGIQLFRPELRDGFGVPDPVIDAAVSGSAASMALSWDRFVAGPRRSKQLAMEAEIKAKLELQERMEEKRVRLEAQAVETAVKAAFAANFASGGPGANLASGAPTGAGGSGVPAAAAAVPAATVQLATAGELGQLLDAVAAAPRDARVSLTYSLQQPVAEGCVAAEGGDGDGIVLNLQLKLHPSPAAVAAEPAQGADS